MKIWITLAACLLLVACGGGGDETPPMRLSVSPAQLTFAASSTGSAPPEQRITGSIENARGTLFMAVLHTDNGISGVSNPIINDNTGFSEVYVKQPFLVGGGEYHDTVTVAACIDPNCSEHIGGSPQTVSVTYRVGLAVKPASVSFRTVESVAAAVQRLELSHYAGTASWSASVSYQEGSDWLRLSTLSGSTLPAFVDLTAKPLATGEYHATVTFSGGGETTAIPVTYTVDSQLAAAVVQPFNISNNNLADQHSRTITLSSGNAAQQLNWSAVSNDPWLQVSPASGDTGPNNQITLSVVRDAMLTLHNGNSIGTVTITPTTPNATPLVLQVPLFKDITQVHYVAPYVGFTNQSADVILRGDRFDERPPTVVQFGDVSVNSFTIVSPTEIRLNAPALPAGRYPVHLVGASGLTGSSAERVVVDQPRFEPSAINPMPSETFLFYDAERSTLYMRLPSCRYRRQGSKWIREEVPIEGAIDMDLTPDGRELIVLQSDRISHLDPVTLETRSSTIWLDYAGFRHMAVANSGIALVTSGYQILHYYDLFTKSLSIDELDGPAVLDLAFAPLDGSRLLLGGGDQLFSDNPIHIYDSSTGTIADSGADLHLFDADLSANGIRALLWGETIDEQGFWVADHGTLLGQLPQYGNEHQYYSYLLTIDGARSLQFDFEAQEFRLLDLAQPDGFGSFARSAPHPLTPTTDMYYYLPAVTPDGGAFFIVGDKNLWTEVIP